MQDGFRQKFSEMLATSTLQRPNMLMLCSQPVAIQLFEVHLIEI